VDSLGRSDTATVSVTLPATSVFTYDLNGNLLSDGTRYFVYDDENQLLSVTVSNAWQSQYVYAGRPSSSHGRGHRDIESAIYEP
jgi:YD repeat-containing protein